MSNGWSPGKNKAVSGGAVVPASQTDYPVSQEIGVTAGGARMMAVMVEASAVTGTVDVKLQTAFDNTWVDSKATTIAAPGRAYITLLAEKAADQTYLPLYAKVRVVVTTGGGEAITVSSVKFLQEL